ncbi:MAG: 4'-phosphopantetheinyl transferase superfamily protein [Nitrospira sp.]|nr:4'-phosphopantetheinyl transferase superfamily protein [Nitrospira sp.]
MMSPLSNVRSASKPFPFLGISDVHVWFCDLLQYAADQAGLAALLSGEEQARAVRFAFDRDRQRYVLSHALLRLILSRYTNQDATCLRFSTGVHGKPALDVSDGGTRVMQFSLSHSGPYALAAVSTGRAVGADVEVRRADIHALKLAQRFFAPSESRLIANAEGELQQQLFYRFWTAKEAYVKGRGVGLSLGLDRFELLFEEDFAAARVRWTESAAFDSAWQVRSLSLPDHLAGAVAVEGDAWELHRYDSTAYPLY